MNTKQTTINIELAQKALDTLEAGRSLAYCVSTARRAGVSLDGIVLNRGKLIDRANAVAERIRLALAAKDF